MYPNKHSIITSNIVRISNGIFSLINSIPYLLHLQKKELQGAFILAAMCLRLFLTEEVESTDNAYNAHT